VRALRRREDTAPSEGRNGKTKTAKEGMDRVEGHTSVEDKDHILDSIIRFAGDLGFGRSSSRPKSEPTLIRTYSVGARTGRSGSARSPTCIN